MEMRSIHGQLVLIEIKAGLVVEENKTIYKVQYGDTLSAVAEAMGIDINVLANLNKITNLDLIFPETIPNDDL